MNRIDLLLRDRDALVARIRAGTELAATMRTMIATIAVAMAVVGAALGSFRGGVQIAYAAIKLPLVLLGTAALSAPALSAIGAALGRKPRVAVDLALVMTALAYAALLLAACTPLVLLAEAMELAYHRAVLLAVVMFALAVLCALRVLGRSLAGRAAEIAGTCVVFTLVGAQLAWALRPYLVRPRADEVVFVRDLDDSLIDSLEQTVDSSRGIYHRDRAALGGE